MTAPLGTDRPREVTVARGSAAEQRMAHVHDVMSSIAGSPTVDEVCRLLATSAAPALGAERAVVALLDDDGKSLRIRGSSGYDPDMIAKNGLFGVDEGTPMGRALLTKRFVLVETQEEYERSFPKMARERGLQGTAFVTAPLLAEGKAIGAVHFGFARHQTVATVERALAVAFANLAAHAIARADAHERDIARQKRDETELALVRAQLLQGEKLAALGSLVSGVAHELRTPLTFLANNAFLAQQRLERAADRGLSAAQARDEAAPFFSEITTGVDRINQLVEDLRKYTKARQDRAFAVESLHALIADAVELFRATNRTKHPVETSLSPTPAVRANRGAVQQLVINLLQNAAEATPPGRPIRIVTRGDADGAVLEVIDHGIGMSPAVLQRMYDPLFTTRSEGTGLGLSIVRRIVDEHRARIECESEPGRGTRFSVVFPRAE